MARGVAGTAVLKAGAAVLQLLMGVVLAHLLGATGYGAFVYALSWATVLALSAVFGLDVLVTREMARCRPREEWGLQRGILRWSTLLVLVGSACVMAAAGAGIALAGHNFPNVTRSTLWVAIPLVLILALLRLKQGAIQGLGYSVAAQRPQFLLMPSAFLLIVLGISFVTKPTPPGAMFAYSVAASLALGYGALLARQRMPTPGLSILPEYDVRRWLRSAGPMWIITMAAVLNDQISSLVLGTVSGQEPLGVYDVARRLSNIVAFLLVVVNMPLAPIIAEAYAKGEIAQLQRIITRSARGAFLVALLLVGYFMMSGTAILGWFGQTFKAGHIALVILSFGQLINVAMGSVGLLLTMTGYERDAARGLMLSVVINVVLSFTLVRIWGMNGAALASAVSIGVWNAVLAIFVFRRLKIRAGILGR